MWKSIEKSGCSGCINLKARDRTNWRDLFEKSAPFPIPCNRLSGKLSFLVRRSPILTCENAFQSMVSSKACVFWLLSRWKATDHAILRDLNLLIKSITLRARLYGLGYPRQPSPPARVTLGELIFHLFLWKVQRIVYTRITNSSRRGETTRGASCFISAGTG